MIYDILYNDIAVSLSRTLEANGYYISFFDSHIHNPNFILCGSETYQGMFSGFRKQPENYGIAFNEGLAGYFHFIHSYLFELHGSFSATGERAEKRNSQKNKKNFFGHLFLRVIFLHLLCRM